MGGRGEGGGWDGILFLGDWRGGKEGEVFVFWGEEGEREVFIFGGGGRGEGVFGGAFGEKDIIYGGGSKFLARGGGFFTGYMHGLSNRSYNSRQTFITTMSTGQAQAIMPSNASFQRLIASRKLSIHVGAFLGKQTLPTKQVCMYAVWNLNKYSRSS